MNKLKKVTALFLIIALIFSGCSKQDEYPEGGQMTLVISQDFGGNILLDITKDYEEMSAMEFLKANVEIETAYGGSFVNAIEEIESGYTEKKEKKKTDWFYYINGFLSQIGSAEYDLKPNDVIQWDFHDWSNRYVSSIIGAFPKDLVNGYGDSKHSLQVMIEPEFFDFEDELKQYFEDQGIENIEIIEGIQEIKNDDNNTLVIGLWEDILGNKFVSRMVQAGERTGVFFHIEEHIELMDNYQEVFFESDKGSIITSFIKDMGNMTKLYLITGNDSESIRKALDVLLYETEKIESTFSVYVDQEKNVIKFPQ